MIQGINSGVDTRKGSKGKLFNPATVTWHTEKKTETVKPDSDPEESDNNKDSEKVEEEEGEVAEDNGDKPKRLEDEVQRKRRKFSATKENASKDGSDHV